VNRKHRELCRLERAIFDPSNTGAVIANSRMVADEITTRFAFPAERLHVVYNGIGTGLPNMDHGEARRRVGVDDDAYVALFVGSGWDRKGLRFAIEAVERVRGTTLVVAGRGPAAAHASHAVKFLGPMGDLTAIFAAADVFVLPTIYDPFSNACLEALAAGLPVLTTPANGLSEILQPGLHGDTAPVGDVRALASLLETWRDPVRRATAQPACRALAEAHSIERNVTETIQVLANSKVITSHARSEG
jgi:UDP-glucose:(heptosyl)LPS alpha-1,3-glucosyltransferase